MMFRMPRSICLEAMRKCCSSEIWQKMGNGSSLRLMWCPKRRRTMCPARWSLALLWLKTMTGSGRNCCECDEHLKNQKGYLGLTPLDSINGWRLQFEQNPEKGLQLYFTPLKVNGDTHVLPVGVRWNPATNRYQSLDASYEHFLKESTSLQNVRSTLR